MITNNQHTPPNLRIKPNNLLLRRILTTSVAQRCFATFFAACCLHVLTGCSSTDAESTATNTVTGSKAQQALIRPCSLAPVTPVFSGPGLSGSTLRSTLVNLIDKVRNSGAINATTYGWTNSTAGIAMAKAFCSAHERGVAVKIIIGRPPEGTEEHGGEEREGPSDILDACGLTPLECLDGCIGDNIMHNKFMTLSDVCGIYNVAVESSGNFDYGLQGIHNNLVIFSNDHGLFDGYNEYFYDLWYYGFFGLKYADYYTYFYSSASNLAKVYLFPRAEDHASPGETSDTIVNVLDNVQCTGKGEPAGEIRVAMAFWTRGRWDILQRLVELESAGCSVKILVRDSTNPDSGYWEFIRGETDDDGRYSLENSGLPYRLTPESGVGGGGKLHSKYLLVNALYGGSSREKIVWTGSHNYTKNALRSNDESLIRIKNEAVYDQFLDNWKFMYKQQVIGNAYHCSAAQRCLAEEGDCDYPGTDTQCQAGLVCRSDLGEAFGRENWEDVCVNPGHKDFCAGSAPCAAGEGDCDVGQCEEGLRCYQNVGDQYGFKSEVDVCDV